MYTKLYKWKTIDVYRLEKNMNLSESVYPEFYISGDYGFLYDLQAKVGTRLLRYRLPFFVEMISEDSTNGHLKLSTVEGRLKNIILVPALTVSTTQLPVVCLFINS